MLKTISILGFLGMAGGAAALVMTHCLFSSSPLVIIAQGAAIILMLWARWAFGRRSFHFSANPTAGELVTTGPYRCIRHPIYSAVCLFIVAGVVVHWSWLSALLGGLVLVGAMIRIFCEENLLRTQYPQYAVYAAKTWRMIPYVY